jgi:hypothetical protein
MERGDLTHDEVAKALRVTDTMHDEPLVMSCGFHVYRAESEERWQDAADVDSDILDMGQKETRDRASEECELLDVDDAGSGDDPDVEEVTREDVERADPEREPPEPEREPRPLAVEVGCLRDDVRAGWLQAREVIDRGGYEKRRDREDDVREQFDREDYPVLSYEEGYVLARFKLEFTQISGNRSVRSRL